MAAKRLCVFAGSAEGDDPRYSAAAEAVGTELAEREIELVYGGAVFGFQSKAKGTQSSPRTLTSWVVNLDQPLRSAMKLEAGYPTETTFAKLKTTFPKGKLSKIALGESAVWIFTTRSSWAEEQASAR